MKKQLCNALAGRAWPKNNSKKKLYLKSCRRQALRQQGLALRQQGCVRLTNHDRAWTVRPPAYKIHIK